MTPNYITVPGNPVGYTTHRILSLRGVLNYISAIHITAPGNPSMRGWMHHAQNSIHGRCAGLYKCNSHHRARKSSWLHHAQNPIHGRCAGLYKCKLCCCARKSNCLHRARHPISARCAGLYDLKLYYHARKSSWLHHAQNLIHGRCAGLYKCSANYITMNKCRLMFGYLLSFTGCTNTTTTRHRTSFLSHPLEPLFIQISNIKIMSAVMNVTTSN